MHYITILKTASTVLATLALCAFFSHSIGIAGLASIIVILISLSVLIAALTDYKTNRDYRSRNQSSYSDARVTNTEQSEPYLHFQD